MAPSHHDLPASRADLPQSALLALGLTLTLRLGLGLVMAATWAVARPSVAGLVPVGTYGELPMPKSALGEAAAASGCAGTLSNTSTSLFVGISTWAKAPRSSSRSTPG